MSDPELPSLELRTPPPRRPERASKTFSSIAISVGVAVAGGVVLAAATDGVSMFFIGITQGVYMVPAYIVARARERRDVGRVLVILGGITFLLNAACFGILAGSL